MKQLGCFLIFVGFLAFFASCGGQTICKVTTQGVELCKTVQASGLCPNGYSSVSTCEEQSYYTAECTEGKTNNGNAIHAYFKYTEEAAKTLAKNSCIAIKGTFTEL